MRPGVHHCIVERRSIFLDLARDRYFALPANLDAAFMRAIDSSGVPSVTADEIERLMKAGVLVAVDEPEAPISPDTPTMPMFDRSTSPVEVRPSPATVVGVVLTQLVAWLIVRIIPMRFVVRHLQRIHARVDKHAGDMTAMDKLAAGFRVAGVLLKSEGNCLPRTLAFVWLAHRRGCHANLVIGVRINPFSAHCWPQHGDVVLNDRMDRVAQFQPILRV